MAKQTKKTARSRTITAQLFNQWKRLTRQGDVRALVAHTGKSAPTIVNAITYGAVNSQELIDSINAFFESRAKAEKKQAAKLKNMQE